ncbi:MAG: response regulator [Candidatus Cloacimonetes bacterium]|nr:response regulator [Candidatus Cloacimonadota bacterium]
MPKRICIVDDEEELILNLKAELSDMHPDWEIHPFTNGMDALRLILEGGVHLLLTDIAMPDMDGYELYWRVQEHDASIPIIMMTGFGYDPNHVVVRARTDGLKDVLFKPFPVEKLAAMMEQRLAESPQKA